MGAYVPGVSTRKVDALVAALGSQSCISISQASLICAGIDLQLQAFLRGLLVARGCAYLCLDATYLHCRPGRTVQSFRCRAARRNLSGFTNAIRRMP
jgi:putative transposase